MNDLKASFAALGPNDKAMFLARVAHMATIAARESYASSADHPERNFDHPDAIILRDTNNFVHRVTGYIMHVLDRTEMAGQDESVIAMIERYYQERGLGSLLSEWLATSD
jgi:hypothetical protein